MKSKPIIYKVSHSLLSKTTTIEGREVIVKGYQVNPSGVRYLVGDKDGELLLDEFELLETKQNNKIGFKI